MAIIAEQIKAECSYCGNTTPHTLEHTYTYSMPFEEIEGKKFYEDYTWVAYSCQICGGLNIYGDFFGVYKGKDFKRLKLHPKGSGLLPPEHMLSPSKPVPSRILKTYEKVYCLKHKEPSAYISQIRRLLEYICKNKEASGKDLFSKLNDLAGKGVLPGHFVDITDLLRKVGNMSIHASDKDVDIWDAELIDDLFRFVIEYVYIAPAKIKRLMERIK